MKNPAAKVARIIGLLSLLVALAGCSAIQLGYNTLPSVAYWWLDGYLDFDDAQEQRVREDIARIHAWHRTQELPLIVQLLARMERMAATDLTAEQVCALEPEIHKRWMALREQLEPAIASHAQTLTSTQLVHLQRKYAGNLREFERDWLRPPPGELLDKRVKRMQERLERVYGTLTDGQAATLRQLVEGMPFPARQILQERRRRQQDTMAVLRQLSGSPVPADQAGALVRGLLDRMLHSPDPAYAAYQQAFRQDTCRLIAQLHNSSTAAQRQHAARRLRAWQRDLQELAGHS